MVNFGENITNGINSRSHARIRKRNTEECDKDERPVRIKLLTGTEEESLIRLAEEWDELAEIAGDSVYSKFDWLFCWWKYFGRHPKREFFVVTVYSGKQLIGIAPFYIGKSAVGAFTLQRRLYLMGCGTSQNEFFGFTKDYGYSDFLDIIVHPSWYEVVAKKIGELLARNQMNVDVICLQHVNDESFVVRYLLPELENLDIAYMREKTDECPFLKLPDTLDDYIEQTGPSSKRRRLRKNLEAVGNEYSIEQVSTPEKVQEGLELLVNLHQARWNSLGLPGAFYDERHLNFVMEISQVFCYKGWLWFKIAIDEQGSSSVRLAIYDGNVFYDWLSGFDSSAPSAKYRPGLGLLAVMIKEAIESEASKVELMRGDERYKFDFTSESYQNWRITIPVYKSKGRSKVIKHNFLNGLSKIYNRLKREWTLLKIQRKKNGIIKMFFTYGLFRLKSLKMKYGRN